MFSSLLLFGHHPHSAHSSGAAAAPPLPEASITHVPRLTDLYHIGSRRLNLGGFKRVFKARHIATGQDCVLGLVTAEHYSSRSAIAAANREVQMHQHLNSLGSPRLIRLLGAHTFPSHTGGLRLAVAMELADGGDLMDAVTSRGAPLSVAQAKSYFRDLQEGLASMHRAGM